VSAMLSLARWPPNANAIGSSVFDQLLQAS
jgi:hypothetical protein